MVLSYTSTIKTIIKMNIYLNASSFQESVILFFFGMSKTNIKLSYNKNLFITFLTRCDTTCFCLTSDLKATNFFEAVFFFVNY